MKNELVRQMWCLVNSSRKNSIVLFIIISLFPLEGEPACNDPLNEWTGATGNQRWNNVGNWSICIPGAAITDQDIATFGTLGSGTISLDAAGGDPAISPGLNSLSFNNLTGFTINSSGTTNHIQFNVAGSVQPSIQVFAGNHTMNSVSTINNTTLNISIADSSQLTVQQNMNDITLGSVIFTGPGEIKVAPLVANRGIAVAGSFTQLSGTVENTNNLSASSLTGSRISATSGLFIDGGSYISRNSATMTVSGTGASNESTGATGQMILNQGSILVENSGMINGSSAKGSAFNIGTLGITINGGSLDASNSGPVNNSGSNIGCQFFTTGPITINEGTITSTNTAAINSALPSRGCNFQATTDFTINKGTFTQTNTGTINGTNALGCSITTSANTILNGGTITSINNGTISAGTGVRFFGNTNLTINNGTVLSENNGTINATNAFGSALVSNANVNILGGVVTSTNTGTINAGVGSQVRGVQNFTQSGGVLTLDNSGIVNSGSGTMGVQLIAPNIQISGGTTTLKNSGTVTNSATDSVGTQMRATTNLTMSGGTLTINANTGAVSGTNNSGCRVEAVGTFTLSGGTLLNDDTVQTPILTIGTFGNMAGKGSFSDINNAQTTQITNSGTVTPGNPGSGAASPGVMSINGVYTQSSSGKLVVNVLNPSTFSQLNILGSTPGTAQLDGNLEIGLSPGSSFVPGDVFSIVKTEQTTGLTGTFANLINNAPDLVPHIQYFSNHVDLFFTPTASKFIGGFSDTLLSSINQINVSLGRQIMRLCGRLAQRTDQINTVSRGQAFSHKLIAANEENFNYASGMQRLPWDLYFGPTGNLGEVFDVENQPGFDYWSAGATAGFDYAFSQAGIGLRFDYDHIDGTADQWGRFIVDEAHACLYGIYALKQAPDFAFNGIIGGSYEWYQLFRTVAMLANPALGKPNGGEFDALLEVEYAISNRQIKKIPESLRFVPLVNLQYVYLNVGQYEEENADTFGLRMNSQTVQSLRSTLGTRFNYTWVKENGSSLPTVLTTEIDIAWQREYLNNSRSAQITPVAFVQPFSTLIIPGSGRNIILAGIDVLATYHGNYGWEASYDFEWNSHYLNHNFYLGFNANF